MSSLVSRVVTPELIEFDPDTDGLAKEGHMYIQFGARLYELDVKLRMLEPHELAQAQGIRKDYQFTGNTTEQVKQIGNAVPRRLVRAIVAAALTQNPDAPEIVLHWEETRGKETLLAAAA